METSDYVIGIVGFFLIIALVLGVPYGAYRYGKFAERRMLTSLFVQMTQDTYYDGWGDGYKQGKKDVKCPTIDQLMDNEDGRY